MGQVSNLISIAQPENVPDHMYAGILPATFPEWMRLVPGMNAKTASQRKPPRSVGLQVQNPSVALSPLLGKTSSFLPAALRSIHPSQLGSVAIDLACIRMAFLFCSWERPGRTFDWQVFTGSCLFFFCFAVQEGFYSSDSERAHSDFRSVVKTFCWTGLLTMLVIPSARSSVSVVLQFIVLSCTLLWVRRQVLRKIARRGRKSRNVLLVGSGRAANLVAEMARALSSCRTLKVCLTEAQLRGSHGASLLSLAARRECIDEVIIATPDQEVAVFAARQSRLSGLDVTYVPELLAGFAATNLELVDGIPMYSLQEVRLPHFALAFKRLTDILISGIGLIVTAPLLVLIAAIIRLDSPGPAIYKSRRAGYKGCSFTCYKFRTMSVDAETQKEQLRARNERSGAFFKIAHDPRITSIGRFLRRYSLDELPQLWNVLIGDMSLVGPRPHPPDDVERYAVEHMRRLDTVPGMTGLWQVTARQDPSFEYSVALDVEYIRTWSLVRDLQILWKTMSVVLQGSGA